MRSYLILLLLVGLVGCANTPQKAENVVLVPKTDKVNLPQHLIKKCEPLSAIPVKAYTQGEVESLVKSLIDQSEICRSKHSILVDTVIKAFNLQVVNK